MVRLLIGITVFFSCFYFYTGGGWNQAAHFDLVRAIVSQGLVRIDAYRENTGDVSFTGGHYYSNKAPGVALASVPFVAAAHWTAKAFHVKESWEDRLLLIEYRVALLAGATGPTVVLALLLFELGLAFGGSLEASAGAALAFGLGTPAWGYATFLWGHSLAAACLLGSYTMAVLLAGSDSLVQDWKRGIALGVLSGWAVLTEYQAFGAAVIIVMLALWQVRLEGKSRMLRMGAWISLGALGPAAALVIYQLCAFGSPLHLSYSSSLTLKEYGGGSFGFTGFNPAACAELLVGLYRGLFPAAPVLILAPLGLIQLLKDSRWRASAIAAGGIFIYYLAVNASLDYWPAGWCFGPRYLFPGSAFLAIGLAPAWGLMSDRARLVPRALFAASMFINLVAVATNPLTPESEHSPWLHYLWPQFMRGHLSQNKAMFPSATLAGSYNLGEASGLSGLTSLVPLIVVWTLLVSIWVLYSRRASSRQV